MQPERQPNIPFTYEEYRLLPEDGRRYELIEGEFVVTPAPSPMHQRVSRRLQHALMLQLEDTGIAEIFNAPCDIILAPTTVVQPDLALIRTTRKHLISARGIEGPPDAVAEIFSPSTRDKDAYLKRPTYAKYGIPEYWLVDPDLGMIELLRLTAGKYETYGRFDRASVFRSVEFPEVAIPMAPLFHS